MQTTRPKWGLGFVVFLASGLSSESSGIRLGPEAIPVRTADFVLIVENSQGGLQPGTTASETESIMALSQPEGSCGVIRETSLVATTTPMAPPDAEACDLQAGLVRIELSIDVDSALHEALGSNLDTTVGFVEELVAQVDAVYRRDFGAAIKLRSLVVRTTAMDDPYRAVDSLSIILTLRSIWNTQLDEHRGDMVHLLSGQGFEGTLIGRSYLDGLCAGNRYSISSILSKAAPALRTQLVAHELGHTIGAEHCNHTSSNNYSEDCHIMCASIGECSGPGLPSFLELGCGY